MYSMEGLEYKGESFRHTHKAIDPALGELGKANTEGYVPQGTWEVCDVLFHSMKGISMGCA